MNIVFSHFKTEIVVKISQVKVGHVTVLSGGISQSIVAVRFNPDDRCQSGRGCVPMYLQVGRGSCRGPMHRKSDLKSILLTNHDQICEENE
jgi:hypothetical protein